MKKDLLELDRLPTLDELKEFFKENDWTSTKIDDPAKRTPEEQAEIEYTAKLMDKKFEELARKKGRNSATRYYSEDNPLIALQNNTEDLVASAVVKIANDDELTDAFLSQFDLTDPDIDKKADDFLHNAVNAMLDVMEYEKLAKIVRLNSDEKDFNEKVANNYRLKDHVRRWEHTKDKAKNILTPDPNAELREPPKSVEDEAIGNVLVEQFMETLDETDSKIFSRKLAGYTQSEIAKELGFASNSAVSKRLADMVRRFKENAKIKKLKNFDFEEYFVYT